MELFGKKIEKKELLEKIGNLNQIGGIQTFEYNDGTSKGIRAANIKSASGIDITVLFDRCMDISHLFYKSIPINWNSPSKETFPTYYNSKGTEWLKTFYGGLLTTCGLSNIGMPNIDNGEELGLHGRISNSPAENISINEEWIDDDYKMVIKGIIREAFFKGLKLEIRREITTYHSTPKITLEDKISNIGYSKSPLMILYHINIGYPLLDYTSKLLIGKSKILPFDEYSERKLENYYKFSSPILGFKDEVFFHEIEQDKKGDINIAFVNPNFNNKQGLGLWLKFNKDALPYLIQWKHLEKGEYVCGIEPANSLIRGRNTEKKDKTLKFIKPSETKTYKLEFKILKSNTEIHNFTKNYC